MERPLSIGFAKNLVTRMSVSEKVGTMMHATLPGAGGLLGRAEAYDLEALAGIVGDKHVTSFLTRLTLAPAALAEQNNLAQRIAERTRLGIPLTISSDPRSHFSTFSALRKAAPEPPSGPSCSASPRCAIPSW